MQLAIAAKLAHLIEGPVNGRDVQTQSDFATTPYRVGLGQRAA